ncbi:MAG: alpha-D-ribose 1-methylphosphonate 5-triphosphate diphosphatase [Clostridium sp.]|uniref:alpha-D-ribose 1-methylphosphonate 5-triphosphate diphosphatase n=1 Tax=Clostridium sp. TaxID=1506 RepID=UPI003F336BA9
MRTFIGNGKIVTEYGVLENFGLVLNDDRIEGLFLDHFKKECDKVIDAKGGYITPGFIDIHSDYIELMASPRPTAMLDFDLGIKETERVLASCGITTMYHSLSFIKDDEFSTKKIREKDNARRLLKVISDRQKGLVRNRFHARLEVDNLEMVEEIKELIKEKKIGLLSIMDHSPGQGQYNDLNIYRETLKGYRDIEDSEIEKILLNHKLKGKIGFEEIKELVNLARENGINVASHDDDTTTKLQTNKELCINISEFPIKLDVAKKAKEMNMLTVMGAPNVLLGGSHSGNLSATVGILENVVDILCSDYYPQGLLHSVFILNEKHGIKLEDAFKFVTLNPAKATNIDKDYGSIEKGKISDILIINKDDEGLPFISKTIVNGKVIFSIGEK